MSGLVGGEHRMSFMSGWQPQEITWEKTHLIPHGVCPTSSNLPRCMGWDWCRLAKYRGEKRTHVPVSGKGILCSSMSHGATGWSLGGLITPPCKTGIIGDYSSFSNPQDLTAENLMQISTCNLCRQRRNHPAHAVFMTHKGCNSKHWWESCACFWDGCRVTQVQGES